MLLDKLPAELKAAEWGRKTRKITYRLPSLWGHVQKLVCLEERRTPHAPRRAAQYDEEEASSEACHEGITKEVGSPSLIYRTPYSLGQFLDVAVMRDDLADHWRKILGR